MTIIFQLRYSIIVRERERSSTTDFKIARGLSVEEYAKALFSRERLDVHEHMFARVTLPSLLRQIERSPDFDARLLLYVSEWLPQEYRRRLDRLIDGHDCIDLITVDPDIAPDFSGDIENYLKTNANKNRLENKISIATVRIDDDDALCKNYLNNLMKYVRPAFSGMCVSFINGYLATHGVETGKLKEFIAYNYPFNAQGLAFVNRYDLSSGFWEHEPGTVLELGSHLKVCDRYPVICDGREPSFLLVHHPKSDSYKDSYLRELLANNDKVGADRILETFDLDEATL